METVKLKRISTDEAIELLMPGDEVSVISCSPGSYHRDRWPRTRVISYFRGKGVELAGTTARAMNHGLQVNLGGGQFLLIETGHA